MDGNIARAPSPRRQRELTEALRVDLGQPKTMPQLRFQILELFLLAIPVACVAWTVTHEEVFREPREYCKRRSESCRRWYQRKFFYLFTCEYCFSHYIAVIFVALAQYKLLFADWRGYLISWFAVVWV